SFSRKELDVSTICPLPPNNSTLAIEIIGVGVSTQTISTNNGILAGLVYQVSRNPFSTRKAIAKRSQSVFRILYHIHTPFSQEEFDDAVDSRSPINSKP